MTKFELGEQKFLTTINEKGEQINEQEQLILSQKDALAHKVLELENLKKVKSQVIVKTNTIIDSVFIPFDSSWQNENQFDTILVYDTINMENIIFVPKTFSLVDEHYSIFGEVNKGGVLLDSMRFQNALTLTIGMKSQGIFKKPKPIVLAKNSNPYFQTYSMQNVVIKNELKWYDKKSTWFGVGLIGGFVGGVLINK